MVSERHRQSRCSRVQGLYLRPGRCCHQGDEGHGTVHWRRTNPCGKYTVAGDVVELPQFIPQRSPVHIARLTKAISDNATIKEHVNGQDSLSVVSNAVTLGSEVLHVTKGSIAGRVLVICGKPLMLHLLEPVRLVLACGSVT